MLVWETLIKIWVGECFIDSQQAPKYISHDYQKLTFKKEATQAPGNYVEYKLLKAKRFASYH